MSPASEPLRLAVLSIHTSPLDLPGSGDAGGMNVYVRETSEHLAERGSLVDVYTLATDPDAPVVVEPAPGVRVIHVSIPGMDQAAKEDLANHLVALCIAVADQAEALGAKYDLIHSHYWLSGQVGWGLAKRWQVPLVHTMHTMAKVKNLALAVGDHPEPSLRERGEEQVVQAAAELVANTHREAAELIEHYDALPARVSVVHPGVDLETFSPADGREAARARVGWSQDECVVLFVGRLQPLKAPDVLVKALKHLPATATDGKHLRLVICGGPSGSGSQMLEQLQDLVHKLHLKGRVTFLPPQNATRLADLYRAADVVAVPSYSESFGLVAVEAQACGTPVIAAAVGGLVTAVKNETSGLLVSGHDSMVWAATISRLLHDDPLRERLGRGAIAQARRFSWLQTSDELLAIYERVCSPQRASVSAGE